MDTKKAVVYCRVSTKKQVDEGNSLETQERICKEYALKNDYEIVKTYIEQGESAKTQDRTELQNLLSFCTARKNQISTVIIYKIDRISRNIDDYSQIRIVLKRYGVEIKSASEHFEDSPSGRFMENIIANVAQFDNDVRTERCVNGMRDAVREGRYVWTAPIGYSNVRVGGKATIAPNEMAPLILKAFELVSQDNMSLEDIRFRMTKEGLIGKNDKPISRSLFYILFNNLLYTGWITKFGERHRGLFEPIISEDLFERVQWVLKRRNKRKFNYRLENPDFPLRRFIVLPSGEKATGAWAKGRRERYAYYRFIKQKLQYKKSELEEMYKQLLEQYSMSEIDYQKLREAIKVNLVDTLKDQTEHTKKLQVHISELKERQSMIIQKNIQGFITDSVMREQLSLIQNDIYSTEKLISEMPDIEANVLEALELAKEYLMTPGIVWDKAPFEQKLKLQWFEFPSGITLANEKLRTAHVPSIFKAKDIFLHQKSSSVHSDVQNTNNPKVQTIQKNIAHKGLLGNSEVYWRNIGRTIIELSDILGT